MTSLAIFQKIPTLPSPVSVLSQIPFHLGIREYYYFRKPEYVNFAAMSFVEKKVSIWVPSVYINIQQVYVIFYTNHCLWFDEMSKIYPPTPLASKIEEKLVVKLEMMVTFLWWIKASFPSCSKLSAPSVPSLLYPLPLPLVTILP